MVWGSVVMMVVFSSVQDGSHAHGSGMSSQVVAAVGQRSSVVGAAGHEISSGRSRIMAHPVQIANIVHGQLSVHDETCRRVDSTCRWRVGDTSRE